MKKIISLASSMLLLAGISLAQFEGSVTYSTEYQNLPPEAQAYMQNSDMKIYFKGDKSRSDMNQGMSSAIVITDYKEKFQVQCIEVMGSKYMIRQTLDEFNKETPAPTVKLIDGETKTIAGYKCKKAEVTTKEKDGKTTTSVVWYTEEFKPRTSTDFSRMPGVPGFPMEFETKQGPYTIKTMVKNITKEAVADSKFTVPEGYKATTREEMRKDIQKNMSGGEGGN